MPDEMIIFNHHRPLIAEGKGRGGEVALLYGAREQKQLCANS